MTAPTGNEDEPGGSVEPPPLHESAAPSAGSSLNLSTIKTLLVDDDGGLRQSCASVLLHEGYDLTMAERGDEALALLRRRAFDVVLLDWHMSRVVGRDLLEAAVTAAPGTIVIVMTGKPTIESSLDALRRGAWDYLPKPFSAVQLQILMGRAAHAVAVARESLAEQTRLEREGGNSDLFPVIGVSPVFRKALALARKVAETDASVFLTGESGVGKELFAHFIHRHSRRSSRPFVPLNCAALPEPLLESEMFGHNRGAFTGAIRDKPGLLETAHGGTLFLDELADMSKAIQAKLLRVNQDGVVRRVGSEVGNAVVNVRFISATNQEPEAAVAGGQLRRDLCFRLRVVPIHVPALRDRIEDVPVLAEYFLVQFWRHHRPGLERPRFSAAALRTLAAHAWPGNVRELQNVIEHAVVMVEPGADLEPADLPFLEIPEPRGPALEQPEGVEEGDYYAARDRLLASFDQRFLRRVVARAGGNLSKAARLAGIDRTSFYRLMERHGLDRELLSGDP